MKRSFFFRFLCAAVLGTALHFLYTWQPVPLFGLFAPVNESVWEHLKLLYWPFLLACIPVGRSPVQAPYWGAVCASLLSMPPVLLGIWYTARFGLGISSLGFDIVLYYLILAFGFTLLDRLEKRAWSERMIGVWIMLAGLWGGTLLICSAAPLNLPIFQS